MDKGAVGSAGNAYDGPRGCPYFALLVGAQSMHLQQLDTLRARGCTVAIGRQ